MIIPPTWTAAVPVKAVTNTKSSPTASRATSEHSAFTMTRGGQYQQLQRGQFGGCIVMPSNQINRELLEFIKHYRRTISVGITFNIITVFTIITIIIIVVIIMIIIMIIIATMVRGIRLGFNLEGRS